ncbi:MAG: hypothetical protein H6Q33_2037 [Deltaproteobacteria bacterium]|nr:hypothetical protein [Deltaproteobacteria bacterium]
MDAEITASVLHDIARRCVAADPDISPKEWPAFAARDARSVEQEVTQ